MRTPGRSGRGGGQADNSDVHVTSPFFGFSASGRTPSSNSDVPPEVGATGLSGRVQERRELLDAVDQAGARTSPGGVRVHGVHRYADRQHPAGDQLVGQGG